VNVDPIEILDTIKAVGDVVLPEGKAHDLAHLLADVGQLGLNLLRANFEKHFTADAIVIRGEGFQVGQG